MLFPLTLLFAAQALATSAPTCPDSKNGYQVEKAFFLYRTFCHGLASKGFESQVAFTGSDTDPWISFGYEKASDATGCDENSCARDYESLVAACALRNHTVFGGGNVGSSCGTYNFTIYEPNFTPGGEAKPEIPSGPEITSIVSLVKAKYGLEPGPTTAPSSSSSSVPATTTSHATTTSSSSLGTSSTSITPAVSSFTSTPTAFPSPVINSTLTPTQGPYGNGTRTTILPTGTKSPVAWSTGSAGLGPGATNAPSIPAAKSEGNVNVVGGLVVMAAVLVSGLLL
ncbi:hypothetical protein HYFRA_00008853 [Hymenoscyphus fraxineus]|uniref:Uncharacterized protein n=1 Tax=Hymenoscyphus fraxineus TaxID=746836 RepID=A0A9N9L1S8_9HELO|nr:hypothetical protein HYFRA_00008853 [Hymenoscyphus fraxineus]